MDAVLGSSYQRQLPGYDTEVAPGSTTAEAKKGRGRRPGMPGRSRRRAEDPEQMSGGAFGSVASVLMWVLVIVGSMLLAMFLVQEFSGYVGDPAVRDAADKDAARDARLAVVQRPLGDADEMARRGDYDAAVHTLLLRTLEELTRGLPTALPRSYTSREILARTPMPEAARRALSELVLTVELCHFGSEQAGPDDYRTCCEHFQRFASAYMGQGYRASA